MKTFKLRFLVVVVLAFGSSCADRGFPRCDDIMTGENIKEMIEVAALLGVERSPSQILCDEEGYAFMELEIASTLEERVLIRERASELGWPVTVDGVRDVPGHPLLYVSRDYSAVVWSSY
jgi:hypothetical protein